MKSYSGLFDHMLLDSSLTIAFNGASIGKRDRFDVKRVFLRLNKEKENLYNILVNEELKLVQHPTRKINEASCGKIRDIIKPHYRYEQVVHHLVVNKLKPIILHGFYEYSCGSIPNRGCHFGKKHVERWVNLYNKDTQIYVLKMDIRHFFENIDHDILKDKLREVIHDEKFLRLTYKIIDSHEIGLPLGYYTSQWFANFYLKKFDHMVKEVLGAPHYIRYMDDMVIISDNKAQLHFIRMMISKYLEEYLHVELKDNWQVFPLADSREDKSGRCIDFMGFKFYRNCTTLRKSILKRFRGRVLRASNKPRFTWHDATSIISYMGWVKHADVYQYFNSYILPKIGSLKKLKGQVSRQSRRINIEILERSKNNDKLGKGKRINKAA